jgi:hypothetical protein
MTALARFRRRSAEQRRLLVRAALMLGVMRLAVRLPFRAVSRAIGLHLGEASESVAPEAMARAAAIGWAVRAAASYTPWTSTCLVQALAAAVLLRRHRIDGTLYLGVAREDDTPEGLTAHAWLRCGEVVLTGAAERARYTPVASFATSGV